jgi:hypothetical protein
MAAVPSLEFLTSGDFLRTSMTSLYMLVLIAGSYLPKCSSEAVLGVKRSSPLTVVILTSKHWAIKAMASMSKS